ncbi:RusA family crossover junction endodeoxyribonuclease [Streptomyces uncialis]|uniref:RusA family crossover junction endodeoxyribonuclease n=1 Tax=Streptomyces uncialis TaxID=1048205 RepID=UPI0036624BC7
MIPPALLLTVYGLPGPQGSKRHVGGGRMIESSAKVKPWRDRVKGTALDRLVNDRGWSCLTGPLRMESTFTFDRPKGHFGTGRNAGRLRPSAPRYPHVVPDLSKLLRSTEDALTDAGVWRDDALVVQHTTAKAYAHSGGDALDRPGAVLRIWRLT